MTEISLQEYHEQIDTTIEEGRYDEAVAHGKHILKQYPKDVMSYQLLGKAMLNSGRSDDAVDMFRRVLGANPEDMVAWIGMSEVHSQRGEFDAAAWYLERAFEQATDNELLGNELRKLYGQRDGKEPQRVQLTRGALARLYLKGDLLSRAINEFRDLLTEQPERVDLSIALAEALWRNEQRLEASEVCQKLLDELPYCIKANLILGEIWTSSGREEEGQTYLRRAEALDPENQMAQDLFGASSPLQARKAYIAPLDPSTLVPEERPAWMTGETEEKGALADVTSALETQIEMPSWLQDAVGEPAITDQAPAMAPPEPITAEPLAEQPPVDQPIEQAVPDWLAGMGDEFLAETPQAPAELEIDTISTTEASSIMDGEEAPDWLPDLGVVPVGEEPDLSAPPSSPTQVPDSEDWLAGIRDQFAEEEGPAEAVPTDVAEFGEAIPAQADIPDWMQELAPSDESAVPDDVPDWLQEPTALPDEETVPAPADIPDWMQELAPSDESAVPDDVPDWLQEPAALPDEETVPEPADIPDWMQELAPAGEGAAPTPDDTPDWLQEPAALPGEETVPEPADIPDWMQELASAGEGAAPTPDDTPDWLQEPTALPDEETVPAPADIPDWMQELAPAGEGALPTPDDTPDWLQEPAALADEETISAPADIPDWMREIEPPDVPRPEAELSTTQATPDEAVAPPTEGIFGKAAFEEPEPAFPPVSDEEEPLITPDWLEGEGVPSGDDALAWLEQLTAGKEDELQAQAQAEAEARMAEIMGRPAPEAAPVEEAVPEPEPTPPVEEAAPAPAEIPDWMQELKPSEEVVPEAPAAEEELLTPDWLEGEGVPSGDDALAWLEQLTAGKEDELQAQAQAEAEARMAEIMGRPAPEAAPVEETVPEPEPEPAPPVEEAAPAPAEIPDWMQELKPSEEVVPEAPAAEEELLTPDWLEGEGVPSGDDALAWLEQLTAGKEDELQAQAQAEAEARMAEIMGRPAPEAAPVEEAVPEPEPAPPVEEAAPAPAEIPDWMQELKPTEEVVPEAPAAEEEFLTPDWLEGEGVPSGDDALAWLEQLAAGKEEELQAQALAESEARMAEIMGRPAPAAAPVEEAVPEPEPAPPVEEIPPAPPEETAPEAPIAEEELFTPDWLEGEGVPSGDDALAWLEQLAAGKEEELQAQAQAESKARMAEIMGRPAPAEAPVVEAAPEEITAPPVEEAIPAIEEPPMPVQLEAEAVTAATVEEAFGWTAFGESQLSPQAQAQAEAEARMAEVVEPPAPAVEAPPVAEVVSEEITAPPVEEITPPAPAVEEAPPPDVAFVPEVAPPVEDIVTPPPAVEPVPSTAQVEAPTLAEPPTAEPDSLAAERAYLKKHPRDYDAWIKLARELWQADKHAESLEAYGRLIRAGKLLEHVIPDLESYLERWPGVDVQTALGDAYMKDGRLQEALDLYRRALGTF